MSATPFVSVVVPTANRHGLLAGCLESLRAQDFSRDAFEILVVHNGPHAEHHRARFVDEAAPAVLHLTLDDADANAARNLGLSAARGDPICFVDDDSVVPHGWLSALVAGMDRHRFAECGGGPVRPLYERAPPRTCKRHELASESLDHGEAEATVGEVWGCNMAVRRSAVARVGAFRPGLPRAQEWEWQQRLLRGGGSIVYVPRAWISHRRRAPDVRTRAVVVGAFRRGFFAGRVRPRRAGWLLAPRIATALAHAAGRRCTRGLTDASRRAGELSGTLVGLVERAGCS